MADPISILAVAGLVYAGRKLSDDTPVKPTTAAKPLELAGETKAHVEYQEEVDSVPAWEPQEDIPFPVTQKREQGTQKRTGAFFRCRTPRHARSNARRRANE